MTFTLESGDRRLAEIHWARHEGSHASAESVDATWTLSRGGFLSPFLTIRATGSETDLVRVSPHLNFHRIEIKGGTTYRLHRAGHLVPAWTISTEDARELAHIEPVRERRALVGGAILVDPPGVNLPELLLLLVASWYFIGLSWFEDEMLVPFEGTDQPDAATPAPSSSSPDGGSPGS